MRANSPLDKWEYRPSRYGALDLFTRETSNPTGIISPELREKAFRSIGNTLEVPVIDFDGTVTIGKSRTVTISDDENTSAMQSITFATYAFGFTQVPAMFMNNEIAEQRDFDTKMTKYILKLAETLDTAGIAALDAGKSQIFGNDLGYTTTGNVVLAALAAQDEILGDIDPIMASNDFYGPNYNVIGNTSLQSIVRKLDEQSMYNQVDKTIQYNNKTFGFTNRLANGVDQKATFYAVQPGSVGLLTRVERESLLRTRLRTGHEWDQVSLPLLGLQAGSYYYESAGDYNAIAGAATADLTRAGKRHYGFALDVAFVTNYNSDDTTYAQPILKMAVATT